MIKYLSALLLTTFLAVSPAGATPLELIYNGVFNTGNAFNLASAPAPTYFASATPYTINAWFDTSTQNYAPSSPPAPPPFAGFRAYAPSLATITFGANTYSIDPITTNPGAGVTVAIFDQQSFTPGRYAVGLLAQPPQDGAGIISDFGNASPAFNTSSLTATNFSSYYGTGYGSGVCTVGSGATCSQHAITPFVLHDGSNNTFALTLGSYDEDYYLTHDPSSPASTGPLYTVSLVATPEPGTCALGCTGLLLLLTAIRRRQ